MEHMNGKDREIEIDLSILDDCDDEEILLKKIEGTSKYEADSFGSIRCPVCNKKIDEYAWFTGIGEYGAEYESVCIKCGEKFVACVKNYKIYEDEDGEMYIE